MQEHKAELLSAHVRERIDGWVAKHPPEHKRSAVISALREVQHENHGYLTPELMDAVADYLSLPSIAVYEVATFYSMLQTEPVGHHAVAVCTNISCMLRGADDLVGHIENRLGIKRGQSTADGRIFFKKEEECLAACTGAPMMQVDHEYYVDLTTGKVDDILDGLLADRNQE